MTTGHRLPAALERLALAGALPSDTDEDRLRKATLTLASVLITLLSFVWVGTYLALGLWLSALIPFSYQVASVVGLVLCVHRKRWSLFRSTQLSLILVLPFLLQWSLGGFVDSSGVCLWAFVATLGAVMVSGPRPAVWWFAGFLALLAVSAGIDATLPSKGDEIPDWLVTVFFLLNMGGVSLTAFVLLEYFVRSRDRAYGLLAQEQDRSERLLLNILPQPIAERLKVSHGVIAERRDEVTVLFADLAGFTPASEELPPEEVVTLLDSIFSSFDSLVERHGLEKIKTIGDGYMVASGIPTARADHAEAAAELGLDMVAAVEAIPAASGLALRVGIDSGPVVAGVIGKTKFSYDLWGDTVNTASRMESHAPPGAIQVSERTYLRLRGRFRFEPRGDLEVKGKGLMTTYLLVGRPVEPEPGAIGAAGAPAGP
jgi:class 3 adenylate cyclase